LFGAGASAAPCYDFLKEKNYNVSCFVDNSTEKQKYLCCGLNVIAPDSFKDGVLFVTNQTYAKAMANAYTRTVGEVAIITLNAFFTLKNIERFKYFKNNVFNDIESKNVLDIMIYENLTSENKFWPGIYNRNQYFCLDELMTDTDEVYVDIGAAVGDTIERFIWEKNGYISKIFAFEPSPNEYQALRHRTKRLIREWMFAENQINLVNAGIAEKTGRRILQANKLGTNNFTFSSAAT
jgi:hypothetical protein